jgi:hypothetical protein
MVRTLARGSKHFEPRGRFQGRFGRERWKFGILGPGPGVVVRTCFEPPGEVRTTILGVWFEWFEWFELSLTS